MSKAEDEYLTCIHQKCSCEKDYIEELEQRNEKFIEDLTVVYLEKNKLEQQKSELIEKFKDLLDDSKYLYQYDPNNFRKTEDEYFKSEIEFLQKYEVKKCGTK